MLPSLRLGRYVVEGLLGPGGVTETYLARLYDEPAAERLFALKLLRQDRVAPPAFAEVARRFLEAGRRLRDFQRPGFAKVIDLSEPGEVPFIVSEHVPGYDLERLLEMSRAEGQERPGVDPELAGLIGAEIARLLQVAHAAKPSFAHLGLGPRNVMVSDGGEVVLLDAGITAAIRSMTERPDERDGFLAPEQRGTGTEISLPVAADVYALGALLFYLMAGRPYPAVAASDPSGDSAALELPGVSPRMSAVLRGLLAPRPEERASSAGAVVERLSPGVNGVRQRQRRIAAGLRHAEAEARAALARQSDARPTPEIQVPRPAESLVADARARARTRSAARARRRLWGSVSFAALGGGAALVSLALTSGVLSLTPVGRLGAGGGAPSSASTPVVASRGGPVGPSSRAELLARLAGRLIVETVPPGATVWVDGVSRGTTFVDVEVGPGSHRVALTLPGHLTYREQVDTSRGAIIRRKLAPAAHPARGQGLVRVECQTMRTYPILLDDEETGFLCPELRLSVPAGKHTLGIYLPATGKVVSVPITVEAGGRTVVARFTE